MSVNWLSFWPISYRPCLIHSHTHVNQTRTTPSNASLHSGYSGGLCGRADSWHAVVIFLAHFTCRELGFRAVKNSQAVCIIHQAAGIRCWSKLRAAFCVCFVSGCFPPPPWKLKHAQEVRKHRSYQRLLWREEGKCFCSRKERMFGFGSLSASRVSLYQI